MTTPYTLSDTNVTFFYRGRPRSISRDHDKFDRLVDAIIGADDEAIDEIINIRQFIAIASFGKVTIDSDDCVRFNGRLVPDYLAKRIITHHKQSPQMIPPLIAFAEKLMSNPTDDVREDLYQWLERGEMPIFPDGDFMAYKVVRGDFTPIHRGTHNEPQSPGKTVEMPRHMCNANRDITCSTGLHFCSYSYLPTMGGYDRRVIALKINPADVVAIPTDYNLSKGRTCRFFVVEEINAQTIKEDFGGRLVVSEQEISNTSAKTNVSSTKGARPDFETLSAALEKYGTKTKAAESLGINRKTFARWLNEGAVS